MTERKLTPDPDDTEGHHKLKDDDTPDSDDTEGHKRH
jgi:hypothetical protein